MPVNPGIVRRKLITVPARIASSAHELTVHLSQNWLWQHAWEGLYTAALSPPAAIVP